MKAGLHLTDLNFAKLYLLACAVGSRYSTDPRVALKAPSEPGMDPEVQWRSVSIIWSRSGYEKPDLMPQGPLVGYSSARSWKSIVRLTFIAGAVTEETSLGPILQPAVLVDLQITALAVLYLEGSGSPYATAWLLSTCLSRLLAAARVLIL